MTTQQRRFKFRAWDEGKMTEPFGAGDTLPEGGRFADSQLMQFIGLHDKNGKEVFEGDIVTSGDNFNSVVTWGDFPEGPGFYLDERGYIYGSRKHTMYAYTNPLEVIGNIYENPELLQK